MSRCERGIPSLESGVIFVLGASMLSLKKAQTILKVALATSREKSMKPLSIVVFDGRGALKAAASEDGTSLDRIKVAMGKARGALSMGVGSRALEKTAKERPHFIAAASHVFDGGLIPVAGGVLIRDAKGNIIGVVGVSGDTSDNDELVAATGIAAAGYVADGGHG